MDRTIFINLPVADLPRSLAFYEAVGWEKEPRFSGDAAAMIVLSDTIRVMLVTHQFFATFTTKPIVDARDVVQTFFNLTAASRDAVDALIARAAAAGAALDPSPVDEHGWMYGRSFEDPDGHMWGVTWMDVAAMPGAPAHDG